MFPHHIECHPITLPRCLMLDFITNQQVCQIPSQPFSLLRQTSGKLLNLSDYHSSFITEKLYTVPSSLLPPPRPLIFYQSSPYPSTRSLCLCIKTLEWKINLLFDICIALVSGRCKRLGDSQDIILFKLHPNYPNFFS